MTVDEIAGQLSLPRTTIYTWIRDIPLDRQRNWSKGQRRGTLAMQAKFRRLREEAYAAGAAEYERLIHLPTFRDFVALYVAEGYKRNRNTLSFANSDTRMVALATSWFSQLTTTRLRFWLQYHADQDPDGLRAYWGDALRIDGTNIAIQRKSNSEQLAGRRWRSRYGALTVVVHDTLLRARMQAWMDRLREDWGLDSAFPSGV